MAAGVDVPVSADLEGGYVDSTGGIDRTVEALVDAGVAGRRPRGLRLRG